MKTAPMVVLVCIAVLVALYVTAVVTLCGLRKAKRAALIRLLQECVTVFDEHGIPYRLCWGTLLGAVREGAIIKNDDDLDFVVLGKHELERAVTCLRNKYGEARVRKDNLYATGIFKTMHADLYYAELQNGQWVRQDVMSHLGAMGTGRTEVTLHGVKADIPDNAHQVLREMYGDTYLTPLDYKKTDGDPRVNVALLNTRKRLKKIGLYI